ncbi:MAG: DUF503 domain-containing protein [Fimbriimonadaceae bacterium]|nr:DUF503 domain-containing protein [Fimbriimonadaceae bacterium]
MMVGIMEVQIALVADSLKGKRHVVRPLIERMRRTCQVAVSEVADHDLWGNATLGIATVSNDAVHVESLFNRIETIMAEYPQIEVRNIWREIERR